jgi:hypothetical protein
MVSPHYTAAPDLRPPWQREVPSLEALESGDGTPADHAWYRTQLFVEDLLATAARIGDPDCDAAPVRARELLAALIDRQSGRVCAPLDELQRAAMFLEGPLRSILDRPNARLTRQHQHVRWERLDELDARCLRWLGRLPGRDTREKSASTPRALGVVRKASPDVAENRVLVRLAHELGPNLERRLGSVAGGGLEEQDGDRLRALRGVTRMLRTELPESALSSVRPALRPEPNNALLGAGRYGRVWRVWRWLRQRQDRFAGRWHDEPKLLGCALGLLVAARVARRPDAFVPENVGMLRLRSPGIRCDLAETVPVDVFILGARPLCLSVAGAGDGVLRMRTLDAMTGANLGCLEVEVSFDSAAVAVGRGCPVRVMWFDYDRDVADERCGWFDWDHIAPLVDGLVDALDLPAETAPALLVAGGRRAQQSDRGGRALGIDLGTLTPTIVDDTGYGGSAEPCIAVSVPLEETVETIVGEAAAGLQGGRQVAARLDLPASWRGIADDAASTATLASALGTLVPEEHSDFELCLPVAEALGEPGEAALRAALPSQVRRAWLIPRTVAAVLALRRENAGAVAEDEPVVVLDCGPLGFEARLVVLRREVGGEGDDPFYWECPLPWPECPDAAGGANREFWLSLAGDAANGQAAPAYVDRVVDSGLIQRIAADTVGRPGACLADEHGRLGPLVRITDAGVAAAATMLADRLEAWIEWLHRVGRLADARRQAEGRRLHLLVVGEPLSLPPVAAALAESCRRLLPEAFLHLPPVATTIAVGALEFLRRRAKCLPTYELALPDLYLKSVDTAGHVESRPIFEKRRVRPGEDVRVDPLLFRLQAKVDKIALPLERDPGGRHHLAWKAMLEGEGLPLPAPLKVDVMVAYRYAEDGFRIRIRPHSASDAALFPEREIRWVRAETSTVASQLRNEPPTFPPPVEVSTAMVADALKKVATFKAEADGFLGHASNWRGGDGFRAFQDNLEETARAVGRLFAGAPAWNLPAKDELTLVDGWVDPLCRLLSYQPRPWRRNRTPDWVVKTSEIRARLPKLAELAETALSRMRHRAPFALAEGLLAAVERYARRDQLPPEQRLMSFGRVVGAMKPERQDFAISTLVSLACTRSALDPDAFHVWWTLGTALWSEERLAHAMAEVDVEHLIDQIGSALNGSNAPGIDLLHELGIVLLGLLRRRGQPDGGPVNAGTERLVVLADRFEELERGFFAQKKGREARLRFGGDLERRDDISRFGDGLCAALRGERVALIQVLED